MFSSSAAAAAAASAFVCRKCGHKDMYWQAECDVSLPIRYLQSTKKFMYKYCRVPCRNGSDYEVLSVDHHGFTYTNRVVFLPAEVYPGG